MTARKTVSKSKSGDNKPHPATKPVTKHASGKNNGKVHTIGSYLIQRLQDYGINDLFGIPGDFVLQFYGMLEESPIRVVGTTREDNAGYAADGYARVNGLGAVCVTYCVGGLSLCNSIAGAYAEKSPVVVISGAPGMAERETDPLLHHRVKDFNTQREVFEKITVATALLNDPMTAFHEIDRCLEACVRFKRPVYLELPRDCVHKKAIIPHIPDDTQPVSDQNALRESLEEAAELIHASKKPVIIAGVEVHRFGLREEVLEFAEKHKIPMCATILGKSVVSESHPLYLGVYEGAMGRSEVQRFVEESDCVILLGTFMTDINLGIYTAHLDPGKCIYATSEKLRISYHHFQDVVFSDFVKALGNHKMKVVVRKIPDHVRPQPIDYKVRPSQPVTTKHLFESINQILSDKTVVVTDVGDCLFGAIDLMISTHTKFLSPAYYTSMGFAIPASIGAQVANQSLRPIVLVGDGAFQMTCLELSTALKLGFNPIVIVLNNKGYTTERFLQEGPFNDIPNWKYHNITDLIGGGWGFEVSTEGDLEKAIKAALANLDSLSVINVHLDPTDVSPALTRLAEKMSKQL
ncbi:thiamine pyrophosphate-binding protein [uncultured Gimesia sp.]|uniref:alpha-keto acid decarboxylase family protein n=1 Tax=uncultured Gimesia sp. TaxID=1678688 RepID=UPI00260398C9|nr:thiamine pyrophosphate-binding protein [uncultured Gimesia sp.]